MTRWWSLELQANMEQLISEGYTAGQVGMALGKTRNAIIGRARRTHVKLNDSRPGRQKPPPGLTSNSNLEEQKPKRFKAKLMVDPMQVRALPKDAVPVPEGGVAIMDLRLHHCRYPLWCDPAPEIQHKRFCGQTTLEGKRWCPEHFERVTQPGSMSRAGFLPQYRIRRSAHSL